MRLISLFGFLFHVLAVAAFPAGAGAAPGDAKDPLLFGKDLKRAGWQTFELPGHRPVTFSGTSSDAVRIQSDRGVSFLYRDVSGFAAAHGRLRWSWRLSEAVPATDLTKRDGDDRAIALHLWFPGTEDDTGDNIDDADRPEWFGDILTSGHILSYVWGGQRPPGSVLPNPHFSNGVQIIIRPGTKPSSALPDGEADDTYGTWHGEEIDYAADFARAFGTAPAGPPALLAISADTDDTDTANVGFVRGLSFMTSPLEAQAKP